MIIDKCSESAGQTEVKDRFREGNNINKSLVYLGMVIRGKYVSLFYILKIVNEKMF